MDVEKGIDIQRRAVEILSSYFNRKLLSVEVLKYSTFDEDSVKSFIRLLHKESDDLNVDFRQHCTQFIIECISHLSDNLESSTCPFLFKIVSELHCRDLLFHAEIQSRANSFPKLLPLELIVKLDKLGIISFVNYFQSCVDNPKKLAHWVRILVHVACEPDAEEDQDLLIYLLSAIIEIGYGVLSPELQETINGKTLKAAMVMINSITRKVWDFLWDTPERKVHLYDIACHEPSRLKILNLLSFQKCCTEQLAFILSYKPEIKATAAINSQHEWTYIKVPANTVHFVTQLLYPLDVQEVVKKIDEILSNYEINWKTLLLVISTIHINYPSGSKTVKGMITSLLQRAMEKSQVELFLPAFLLARQITMENSGASYGVWFSSITTTSTSSKNFALLIKFLSSIARYETISMIKSHLNNPPYIPMVDNCRGVWADYTALLRTRLVDFNTQGLDQASEVDTSTEKEVESAIAAYERSGRVPNSVLEAAIFRKPYFIHKFIPVLLKARPSPEVPDVKEKLIMDLKQSGKLPVSLYDAYVIACCQSSRTAVPTSSEKPMDWQALEQPNDYQDLLQRLAHCRDSSNRSTLLTNISDIFTELLAPLKPQPVVIEIDSFEIDAKQSQNNISQKVVDEWMKHLMACVTTEEQATFDWCSHYFLVLSSHPPLLTALYINTGRFIDQQTGEDHVIRLNGIVLLLLYKHEKALLPIRYRDDFSGHLTALLLPRRMSLKDEQSMSFYLKLFSNMLSDSKCMKVHLESDGLQNIARLNSWLLRRFQHSVHGPLANYVNASGHLSQPVASLELEEWLRMEIDVTSHRDVLQWTERCAYLHQILESDYINSGKCERLQVFSMILESILQHALSQPQRSTDCSSDLLILLQSQIMQQPCAGTRDTSTSVWLIELWQRLLKDRQRSNSIDSIDAMDVTIWSVVCALPAFLLVRNSCHQSVKDSDVATLNQLIERRWRNSVTQGAWLPRHVTNHLLQALSAAHHRQISPCLRFADTIQRENGTLSTWSDQSEPWEALIKAVEIFHPRCWNRRKTSDVRWSRIGPVDHLTSQLMVIAATLWFVEHCNEEDQDWPWFVQELGRCADTSPHLLRAWRISSWTDEGSLLPWNSILPTCFVNVLPYVLLHVLLHWSEMLIRHQQPPTHDEEGPSVWSELLEALAAAHTKWIETTQLFVNLLTNREQIRADYPAGKLMDLATLGRLNIRINQLVANYPLHILDTFLRTDTFRRMDAALRTPVSARCRSNI